MIDTKYRTAYAETRELYDRLAPQMGGKDYGYEILYGPEVVTPSIFILGYQPGYRMKIDEMTEEAKRPAGPPTTLEYASATWPLARALRSIWSADRMNDMMGGNINFFRAVSVNEWTTIPLPVRRELQEHSLGTIQQLVEVYAPRRILVIGLDTLKRIPGHIIDKGHVSSIDPSRHNPIAQEATLWGKPALAVTHLSGARLKAEDRQNIYNYARAWSGI
ncbi:hypothetical protein [Asaia krungthepensis]|uniref:Uracil-DNA glycosylase n=1 Tax=Asaia krungthepensis NRIC 0535 TaxID=1307925 RepID=A0ABQ0Q4N5_9PROT|nr:hypothetical protein [Asaia krungthepensis]GBQ91104.1 hypothetical protein AA0535_2205 [Asaia krungthepensis NRIC 0535]